MVESDATDRASERTSGDILRPREELVTLRAAGWRLLVPLRHVERVLSAAHELAGSDEAFKHACTYRWPESYGALKYMVWALSPQKICESAAKLSKLVPEVDPGPRFVEGFEEMVGKHQAIIASSSYWGEQNFPVNNLNVIWRHKSLPLVFWSPWDKPYEEDHGPDKFSLTEILAGKWDTYIDKWAEAAREFGHPIIVVFGVEMNGSWFPWSGAYYGGAQWVPECNNWKGPETFRRAYRYVVDRVRARGASNIKWMFHTNNYPYPYETWNCAPAYYPGSDYVDWLGLSVYGQQYKDEPNPDIPSLVDWPYEEMCRLDPKKPVMIAEWATGEFPLTTAPPSAMRKPAWIKQGLELFRTRYPRVKAALYWHERWQNADGSYSNLRVNSSVESLRAYRSGLAHPDWLGNLILRAIPKR